MLPASKSTRFGGIYAIRHVASGKFYLGSAINIPNRLRQHRRHLAKGVHHSRHLQRAWDKHGPEAFVFDVLQRVEDGADLLRIEQEFLDHFRTWRRDLGYNVSRSATAPMLGRKASQEAKAKVAAFHTGRKRPPETAARISAANKGRKHSAESRANMSAAHIGNKLTPEAIAKRIEKIRGRRYSPEHCAAISAAKMGHEVSAEARAKMSASQKARFARERLTQQAPPDGQLLLPFEADD